MSSETITKDGTKMWAINDLPVCDGMSAFVLPGAWFAEVTSFFAEAGFKRANTIEEASVVVFCGGADIDPALYDQKPIDKTFFNKERDIVETFYYAKATNLGIPKVGICRGAQFMAAMNGCELWQDVNNHCGGQHWIVDLDDDVRVMANSYHHQMIKYDESIEVVAVTEEQVATRFEDENYVLDLNKGNKHTAELEIEAGCFREKGDIFFQGHPEVGSKHYRSWCMHKIKDFIIEWKLKEPVPTPEQKLIPPRLH